MDFHFIHLQETGSTNLYIRELQQVEPIADGTVVYTDIQTSGRGQRGNSWESEPYKNLTFSLLLQPKQIKASQSFTISEIVSLAITDALEKYATGFSIKWPNDIYWYDKKIAGILIENDLTGNRIETSVIGIGLNINQKTFLSAAPNPVSLIQILNREIDLFPLLTDILNRIAERSSAIDLPALTLRYKSRLYRREGYHTYQSEEKKFQARIADIDPTGRLVLETVTGERKSFAFKEVSFVI